MNIKFLQKKIKFSLILLAVIIIVFIFSFLKNNPQSMRAQSYNTYYISTTGSDSNSGTSLQPFSTFKHAFSIIESGDTLIIKNGAYNQNIGEWKWSSGVKIPTSYPKAGANQQKTIIKGESVGGVIIDGSLNAIKWENVIVEQFTFLNGGEIGGSNNLEIKKSGFKGGLITGGSSYILKQDIWAWGSNRYVIHNYRSDYIIDNRVIARLDDIGKVQPLPVGAISHYLTDYSVIANALLFDVSGTFEQPYDLVYSSRPEEGFDKLYGIIGFNAGSQLGGIFPADNGRGGYEIYNSAIFGTNHRGIRFNADGPNLVSDCTIANNGGNAIDGWHDITVKNNLFYNNSGFGAEVVSCDNNLFYDNPILGGCANSDTVTVPDIKYIPRSPISGKGANIENRYNIALIDNEYEVTETTENLWPWPYEDIIKRDMCAENNYGWCSADKTLTEYIWEYLGNPCPSDICNYGSTPEPDPEPVPEPEPVVPPSVTLTKQVDQSQSSSGDVLTYTIIYENTSSVEAKNIIITDKIQEGATYTEDSVTNGGIYNSGLNELTWTISSLPAGASGQVSFQIEVN